MSKGTTNQEPSLFNHSQAPIPPKLSEEEFLTQRHPQDDAPPKDRNPSAFNFPAAHPAPKMWSPGASSSDSMSDDLRLAMKLQAHYNAEGASPPPESTPAPYKKPRLQGEPVLDRTALEADEQYARYVAGLSNDTDSTLLITSLSEADDLKFARELQAKFDSEVSRTPQPELSAASEREMIASYGSAVLKLRCFTCKCPLMPNVGSVDELNAIWSGRKHASSVLTCSACRTWTCCGCGGPPKAVHRRNVEGWSVTFCCDEGRLFLLWSLLCSVKHSTSSKTAAPISMSPSRTQRPGSFRKSGVGYGDDLHVRHRKGRDRPIEMKRDVDPTDDPTRRLLATLAALLPSWKNGAQFDNDAPPVLEGMLRRSAVMEKAAELLRNDSVEEIARRGDLYAALIEFLDVLARHPATARVLYDDRAPRSESYDLVTLSFSASHLPPKRESAEKNQSLAKIMQNLRVQADTFLKQYRMHWADTYEDSHSELAYNLSTEIAELASFVEANDSRKIVKQPEVRSDEQDNREWHREHCVDDVPDEHILEGYHYHGRSEKLQTVPRGRMKKLMLELAALRTSLPEGIYVRHSSSRLDVIKVMIVGPAGTPYENGLFEFDLFCPSNYPHEPPKMQFKTTGKGIAHFNPNLYANGKVCLSLLGTWSGEPWRPNVSTLLQVLVSIQSMVFCDEPWCNEPGRENQVGTGPSLQYNRSIRILTMEHAMLSWARKQQDDPNKNGIWSEVVERHFRTNAESMIQMVKSWSKSERPKMEDADHQFKTHVGLSSHAVGAWQTAGPSAGQLHPAYISPWDMPEDYMSSIGSPSPPQTLSPTTTVPSMGSHGKLPAGQTAKVSGPPYGPSSIWCTQATSKPSAVAVTHSTSLKPLPNVLLQKYSVPVTADDIFGSGQAGAFSKGWTDGWDSLYEHTDSYNLPSATAPSPPSYSPTPTPSSGSDGELPQYLAKVGSMGTASMPPGDPSLMHPATHTPAKMGDVFTSTLGNGYPPVVNSPYWKAPDAYGSHPPSLWLVDSGVFHTPDAKGQPSTKQLHSPHKPAPYIQYHSKAQKSPASLPPAPKPAGGSSLHKPHPLTQVQKADQYAAKYPHTNQKPKPKHKSSAKQKYKLPPPQPTGLQTGPGHKVHHGVPIEIGAQIGHVHHGPGPAPTQQWLEASVAQQQQSGEAQILVDPGAPAEPLPAHVLYHGGGAGLAGLLDGSGESAAAAAGAAGASVAAQSVAVAQFHHRRRREARDRGEAVARELLTRLEQFCGSGMEGSDGAGAWTGGKPVVKLPPVGAGRASEPATAGSARDPIVLESIEKEASVVSGAGTMYHPIVLDDDGDTTMILS